jgi:hypothetical protein
LKNGAHLKHTVMIPGGRDSAGLKKAFDTIEAGW